MRRKNASGPVAPLARDTLHGAFAIVIAVACTVFMFRKVNPVWLVLAASATGLVAGWVVR